jgi:hypothetical protein
MLIQPTCRGPDWTTIGSYDAEFRPYAQLPGCLSGPPIVHALRMRCIVPAHNHQPDCARRLLRRASIGSTGGYCTKGAAGRGDAVLSVSPSRRPASLVFRFRSSHDRAAPPFANFGIEGH